MKTLLSVLAFSSMLFAFSDVGDTASCKKCHPIIAQEFEISMHRKSSIYDDKVYQAIWDKHPDKTKDNYSCSKCHTPNATTKEEQHAGITCISCHTIADITKHDRANENVYSKDKNTLYSAEAGRESEVVKYKTVTSWWGNKTTVGSAYHDIDYTNEKYYTGEMCMGCHSHKQNSHQFDVCRTEEEGAKNKKENCITCHMPKVGGSATTVRKSATHAYHGFAGARVEPRMLAKYVEIGFLKYTNGFDISLENRAPHNLLTHPLRVVQLKVIRVRDEIHTIHKTHTFVKAIGTKGKPSFPWLANQVVKNSMIKANEKRVVNYNDDLERGDRIEVVLGFYVVNPKVLKKLNLQDDKELSKFTVLKRQTFHID
ncbi:MAG: multiheme c-type cytochrome [Campylobacterota bacterium]|nr:multiheme c-type cytochrome [Campylobacterota bacterium]